MINIQITDKMKNLAIQTALKRKEYGFRDESTVGPNYKNNMILMASLGEIVLQEYCKMNNISYKIESDDFHGRILHLDNLTRDVVEIKTSGFYKDFKHLNFMYDKNKYESQTNSNITKVVQIFVNGYENRQFNIYKSNHAVIVGEIDFSNIAFLETRQFGEMYKPAFMTSLENLKKLNL